ncbi:uncharacterized protein LOC125944488 [Dermacentor silvarum]|uniref:uncharacterized protein LOC125944488 n=1 Tax=Dermacentor silvarum TaxID=543639 RepID=UPI002101BFF7|nr:uncharacterized protein LOC125944488 [Dermacentor silvarum]
MMQVAVLLECACMIAVPVASQELIEDNPSLEHYQDEEDCFPFNGTWYTVYRNFENDPYLGGNATCIRTTETGAYAGGSTTATVQYSPNVSLNVKLTLASSSGYSVLNVIQVQSADDPSVNFNLTNAYRDCQKCKVFRHSYINEGQGCSLWKPESQLGTIDTCCDFVFDLLCGTSNKYQIYTAACSDFA